MYLRVSLTERCNLRCVYCLPEQARFSPAACEPEELRLLVSAVVAEAGVRKIRLTGGEPTLDPELLAHVRHARSLVSQVALTSNGLRLEPLLPALRAAGLSRLNVSLDGASPEAFRRVTRRDGFEQVVSALRAARRIGFERLKLNAVALEDTDYAPLVRLGMREGVHVRFIELMEIGEARGFHAARYVAAEEMRRRIAADGLVLRETPERDEPTSRVYTIEGVEPEACTVGFITTVSQPFCETCDRLRLTSQGRLHTCLSDEVGHDLLTPLRRGDLPAVREAVRAAVRAKRPPTRLLRLGTMAAIGG